MSTSLTIRNLPQPVKQKLRMHAASHGRSMEAEARDILTRAVEGRQPSPRTVEEMRERLRAVTGIWKGREGGNGTDAVMEELRGDD